MVNMATIKIHESITTERIMLAIREYDMESPGFCIGCGEEAFGVEPDARGYTCESCEQPLVYGAEELLIMTVA
jgi:hypothetical protein